MTGRGVAARYAVIELVLRQGSFSADVAMAKAAGVAGIGVHAETVDMVGADEARRMLEGEGLRVSSYVGLEPILQGGGGLASLDEAARRLEVAASLGAPGAVLVTGSQGALSLSEAEKVCREWMERANQVARGCGVRIMLEPIHPIMRGLSFVHTFAHGLALIEGIEGFGIVLDVGHVWWEHDLDALVRKHIDDIVSVQLTNVDAEALTDLRYERAQLDSGDVPVASLVRLFESAGYRGWYEYEVLVRTPRDQRLDLLRASREWIEAL